MSRPKQCQKIHSPPLMIGFNPFGVQQSIIDVVILQYDEYEVLRLFDSEGLLQEQAAKK